MHQRPSLTHFGPRRLDFNAMHKMIFYLPLLHGSRCLEAVLESGVVFGFGLLWSGRAGVTIGIQNTSQNRCIDDGAND
jgi:hypothetical protein